MTREFILLYLSISIYAIFIAGELILSSYKRRKSYHTKDSIISIWFAIAGGLLDVLMRGACFFILDFFSRNALFTPQVINVYPALAWLLVFISQDFFFYWLHRAEHSIRLLWAVHSNHHSSQYFNFTVALRSSVLQPLYRFVFYIPIAMLGFDGLTIMFVYAINQIYQFFLHTEYIGTLPLWGKVFVTPSHHRVHHASNKIYLDRNMGQVLIIWDKIFGTFQEEIMDNPPTYGLTANINSYHPVKVLFAEFKRLYTDISRTKKLKNKLYYLIKTPNWKPKEVC